jgi:hypothetical protein
MRDTTNAGQALAASGVRRQSVMLNYFLDRDSRLIEDFAQWNGEKMREHVCNGYREDRLLPCPASLETTYASDVPQDAHVNYSPESPRGCEDWDALVVFLYRRQRVERGR